MTSPQTPAKKLTGKKIVIYALPVVILLIVIALVIKHYASTGVTPQPADIQTPVAAGAESSAEAGNEVSTAATTESRSVFDTEHSPAPHEMTPEELRHNLEHELTISNEPYYEPEYATTVADLHPKTLRYIYWAQLINTARERTDPMMTSLSHKLETRLRERQSEEFPVIRKRYAQITGKTLAQNNIVVEVHGSRNEEIYFISPAFDNDEYVRPFHLGVSGLLRQFRFQDARYFTRAGVQTHRFLPGSRPDTEIHESLE